MQDRKGRGRPRPFSDAPRLGLAGALALALAACGPAGEPTVSEADRRAGAEQHEILLAEFGGAYRGDEAEYVARLGERLAAAAKLDGKCTFTLVNSDVVNAFAVRGCYIYITRGLMGIVNSEAELGAVLGHELGHIVGRHAQRQQRRSLWRMLGVVAVGVITGSERLTQIAGAAAGLFTLRYSRAQEYEADDLGIGYLREAGLDPYESADMLAALGRHERHLSETRGADAARSIPEWARTHPLSGNRAERARRAAKALGVADDALAENRNSYLAAVDGLLYGDDPAQGFVIGRTFAHPGMRIAFQAPAGFSLTNSPQAILIEGPGGTRGQFAGGRMPGGGLPDYTRALFGQLFEGASVSLGPSTSARVNGIDALLTEAVVVADGGQVAVTVAAYDAGATAYHFVMLSDLAAGVPNLSELFGSFRLIGPDEAARLRARVIRVVPAGPADTAGSLARRMASVNPLADFLMLNGLDGDRPLPPGAQVKLVVPRGQ